MVKFLQKSGNHMVMQWYFDDEIFTLHSKVLFGTFLWVYLVFLYCVSIQLFIENTYCLNAGKYDALNSSLGG